MYLFAGRFLCFYAVSQQWTLYQHAYNMVIEDFKPMMGYEIHKKEHIIRSYLAYLNTVERKRNVWTKQDAYCFV